MQQDINVPGHRSKKYVRKAVTRDLRASQRAVLLWEESDLVFTGARGGVLRRGNFRRGAGWAEAVSKAGAPGLHFHDLRHTGNMLAAPGASLADLKARMGHDSARASMIYQHATEEADQAIADALDRRIRDARKTAKDGPDDDDDGTAGTLAKAG